MRIAAAEWQLCDCVLRWNAAWRGIFHGWASFVEWHFCRWTYSTSCECTQRAPVSTSGTTLSRVMVHVRAIGVVNLIWRFESACGSTR